MKKELLKFLALVMVIALIPAVLRGNYLMNVLVFVGIHTMLAVALNLLLGYAGQISLGQAGFFGSRGLPVRYTHHNPWDQSLVGNDHSRRCCRHHRLFYRISHTEAQRALPGDGHSRSWHHNVYQSSMRPFPIPAVLPGLSGIPNLSISGIVFDNDVKNYYLIWGFTLLPILLSLNLVHSRIGRALRAIHDSEVAARVMGVNARLLKVQIFALSACISAVAGSLYAHTMGFISPASFGFNFSVELVTMVIIGGLASIYGSILGAALLTLLPEMLRAFQDYDILLYGLLLIVMTMFMPGGLVKGIPALFGWVRQAIFPRGSQQCLKSEGSHNVSVVSLRSKMSLFRSSEGDNRGYRTERCRQDHPVQHRHRYLPSDGRHNRVGRQGRLRTSSRKAGIARPGAHVPEY